MKISGWIFMLASWGFIICLALFSFGRILGQQGKKKRGS